MLEQTALFDSGPYVATVQAGDTSTPGERRRLRQAAAVRRGVHPLSVVLGYGIRLHPNAGPYEEPAAPGLRCGTCRWRQSLEHHNRAYPKCHAPGNRSADDYERYGPPRLTHGEGTDVRAYWPACVDHELGDPRLSTDAARWSPATNQEESQ